MEFKLHPVREYFYKDKSQPCFSFESFFPLNLIEKQFNITGKDFSYSNNEYLKYSYIYKNLKNVLSNCVIFEEARIFLSKVLPMFPGVLSQEHIECFKKDLPLLKEDFSTSEFNLFNEYIIEGLEKAFIFGKTNISSQVWSKWLQKYCSFEFLNSYLSYNEQKFQGAYDLKFGVSEENNNIQWLSEIFNLNKSQSKVLEAFTFEIKHNCFSILNSYADDFKYHGLNFDMHEQIKHFSHLYNLDMREIYNFLKNKLMIECGLIKNFLKGDNFLIDLAGEKKPLLSFFESRFTLLIDSNFDSKNSLAQVLVNIEKDFETHIGVQDYQYLNPELQTIINALKNTSEPMDILFWGHPGTGKTELSKALAKESNLSVCNITKYDCEERDSLYKNQRFMQLTTAKSFSTVLSDYAILVDEAENILNRKEIKHLLTEQLENKKVHTIWIVNEIEHIEPAYLRRFDYIQEIKSMPLNYRKDLALKLLDNKNEELSYKIAQAMHTPAEVVAAVNWCKKSNNFTWANIQMKMSAYQKALSKVEKSNKTISIEIIAPEQNKEKGLKNFAGYEYLHESANQIKDLFNHPEKYQKMGSKVPKGILLAGEPGVGKTLFAKCLANEISIPIIKADCAMLATHCGAIAELFEEARNHAPCMIFLDEIDVIASSIMDKNGPNTEKQKILNQLLVQMEGFDSLDGVLVLGATHRDYLLDSAVRRSGRFGETIHIRNPSFSDRKAIWKFYTYNSREPHLLDDDINFDILSKLSASMSAADINQCVNMAATYAACHNKEKISHLDLENSCNKLFWGTDAKGMPITPKEQWKTAIHEAGHALIALKNGQGVKRATIRPHLNFLGAVDLDKKEGTYSSNILQIKQHCEILLGGMLAETIVFGYHANGVSSDLNKASSFVMDGLLSYGMGETLGSVVVTSNTPSMSESRLSQLEHEHKIILDECYNNTKIWLVENKKLLIDLACLLVEKRSIGQTELYEWFNQSIYKEQLTLQDAENDATFEQLIALAYGENIPEIM